MVPTALLFGLFVAMPVMAQVPEEYQKLWDDPDVVSRIKDDTERYRKADAVIEIVDAKGAPVKGAEIEAAQQTHEFLFGCNLFVLGQLDTPEMNRKYERTFKQLFNCATIPFYWSDLEPEQGKPRYAEGSSYIWRRPPPDRLIKWCNENGILPKGHALLYSKSIFMPKWTISNDSKAFMVQARNHVEELAGRFGDKIEMWDVINEEICRVAKPHEWHAVPEDYAVQCFKHSGPLFPKDVPMLINDGTLQSHVETDKYEADVRKLLDKGLKVDGIGMQCHMYGKPLKNSRCFPPKQMISAYDQLGKLGLKLYITEITIPTVGKDARACQALAVSNLYRLWFSTPQMAGITWWNLGDGTAYGKENKANGGLVDKNLDPKPSFEALDKLINHEWKTKASGTTCNDGRYTFRGFKGSYKLTVGAPGKSKEFTIDVSSGADAGKLHRLVIR